MDFRRRCHCCVPSSYGVKRPTEKKVGSQFDLFPAAQLLARAFNQLAIIVLPSKASRARPRDGWVLPFWDAVKFIFTSQPLLSSSMYAHK